jgi:hypothetical protein
MINCNIKFALPTPWQDKQAEITKLGYINFFVGPNGSGKSRFCDSLRGHLQNCRFLGTDRLRGMEKNAGMGFIGDNCSGGYQKSFFPHMKNAGRSLGFGIDTLVVLEERLDLRIKVEATLSHLFDRRIILEWDSGNLIPKAILGEGGTAYRLDTEECHGIKELLVLLTHLYNDEHHYLIIDEPELNLHPQFQAYFMQEVRNAAGNPNEGKKVIILVTHSPFILDFRSIDDVKSVMSFDLKHSVPRSIRDISDAASGRLSLLVPRLNVHHKQLFFSDNPIFVEGILDAQILQTVQECRGVSVAGAGSCVIDAGGCEEVNRYLELCVAFGKKAFFLYDLDSLFSGNLRACIRDDETISDFLATIGVDADFGRYCGQLDRKLTDVINLIRQIEPGTGLRPLRDFLDGLAEGEWGKDHWARARVAVLVQLHKNRSSLVNAISASAVQEIEGRLGQISSALRLNNIVLLTGGAIEHYLPSYAGNVFKLDDAAKRKAVEAEIGFLAASVSEEQLAARYGELFDAIKFFPAKFEVDIDKTIVEYLTKYIVELQGLVVHKPDIQKEQIMNTLKTLIPGVDRIFEIGTFQRGKDNQFSAKVLLKEQLGKPGRFVSVTNQTNAGMRQFSIESEHA